MSLTIAIDGPAAAGKGTVARALAADLGLSYLDTGLLYRATAALVSDDVTPEEAARNLTEGDLQRDGLRTAEIGQKASQVSAIPAVRAALLAFQQDFAKRPEGAILDGRDIGTVICPEADLKIFLTASAEARGKRRFAELAAQGSPLSLEDVIADIRTRDARDAGRDAAPMKPADDAIIIDTSEIPADEVIALVSAEVTRRRATS